MVPVIQAASTFIGNTINIGSFGGTNVSLGSKTGASSIPVVIASDQAGVPVTGTFFQGTQPVSFPAGSTIGLTPGTSVYISGNAARGVPVQTVVGCTTSSGLLLAANANRVGLECDSDCDNTAGRVYVNFGSAAATNTMKRLENCSSWQPPMVSTVAVQCLASAGTLSIRCTEYNNQ